MKHKYLYLLITIFLLIGISLFTYKKLKSNETNKEGNIEKRPDIKNEDVDINPPATAPSEEPVKPVLPEPIKPVNPSPQPTKPKPEEPKPTTPVAEPKPEVPTVKPTEPVTPVKPPIQDTIFFKADFETGNLSQWYHTQSCPGRITVVNDPVNSSNKVGLYLVGDNDVKANCPSSPTSDPRAQTLSPAIFKVSALTFRIPINMVNAIKTNKVFNFFITIPLFEYIILF